MKIEKELIGQRLLIRNYRPSDLKAMTDMWFDEETGRYLCDPSPEYVDAEYQSALEGLQDSEKGYYFILELRDKPGVIGSMCAFPDQDGTYDIGYCIHKSLWKKGYGSEALSLLLDWLREIGAKAVTAEAAEENAASCALLEKFGFTVVKLTEFKKYHMDVRYASRIYRLAL